MHGNARVLGCIMGWLHVADCLSATPFDSLHLGSSLPCIAYSSLVFAPATCLYNSISCCVLDIIHSLLIPVWLPQCPAFIFKFSPIFPYSTNLCLSYLVCAFLRLYGPSLSSVWNVCSLLNKLMFFRLCSDLEGEMVTLLTRDSKLCFIFPFPTCMSGGMMERMGTQEA